MKVPPNLPIFNSEKIFIAAELAINQEYELFIKATAVDRSARKLLASGIFIDIQSYEDWSLDCIKKYG